MIEISFCSCVYDSECVPIRTYLNPHENSQLNKMSIKCIKIYHNMFSVNHCFSPTMSPKELKHSILCIFFSPPFPYSVHENTHVCKSAAHGVTDTPNNSLISLLGEWRSDFTLLVNRWAANKHPVFWEPLEVLLLSPL